MGVFLLNKRGETSPRSTGRDGKALGVPAGGFSLPSKAVLSGYVAGMPNQADHEVRPSRWSHYNCPTESTQSNTRNTCHILNPRAPEVLKSRCVACVDSVLLLCCFCNAALQMPDQINTSNTECLWHLYSTLTCVALLVP